MTGGARNANSTWQACLRAARPPPIWGGWPGTGGSGIRSGWRRSWPLPVTHAGRCTCAGTRAAKPGSSIVLDHVILLEIDGPTMLWLLDEPSRDNDFGRSATPAALLRRWLPGYQARMRTCGGGGRRRNRPAGIGHRVDPVPHRTRGASPSMTDARADRPPRHPASADSDHVPGKLQ
jgi:hypothetical protein